ncbi:Transposase DDE domain-containing protein [Micromonospora coriariae]|uniref:Transposase DDE domain-containing protein n=1 Tax=Micromonospora coriariae TaxID=285665 RepID=A0A1C4UC27_9ACTN|nr:Transposase DDE domain-containing protein [Micromonospora coriariae]
MAERPLVGPVRRAAATPSRYRSHPSAGLSPPAYRRPDRVRQVAAGAAVRLLLPGHRRLLLDDLAVDGCITKAPGGGEVAGRSPVDRSKQGMKRSVMVEARGIPLGRVLAGAHRHDSPLLESTLDRLDDLGPLPGTITVHLDAGYDSRKTRDLLTARRLVSSLACGGRPGSGRFRAALERPDVGAVDHRPGHVQLPGGPEFAQQHFVLLLPHAGVVPVSTCPSRSSPTRSRVPGAGARTGSPCRARTGSRTTPCGHPAAYGRDSDADVVLEVAATARSLPAARPRRSTAAAHPSSRPSTPVDHPSRTNAPRSFC